MEIELPNPTMVAPSPSGILPTGSLLESLITISNEVSSMDNLPNIQMKNISTIIRRIKLLSSLFEDLQETNIPLPPSSVLCLTELYSVIQRAKTLIQSCKNGSCLWSLIQTEFISNMFCVLVKDMARALDILPLSLLNLAADTREQVELVHKQAKRVDLLIEVKEVDKREQLLQIMNHKNMKNRELLDFGKVKEVLSSIGLRSLFDLDDELEKLKTEAEKQAGTGGLIVVSKINNLISLLTYSKSTIFQNTKQEEFKNQLKFSVSSTSQSFITNIPDEFRCPISLDIMRDPVIVASGHTYDRNSIAQWINAGHHTCPKSGQRLIHMALIPNYALKCLVQQWCQDNNVPLLECSESEKVSNKRKSREKAIDHIAAIKAASESVKMTAEFLVGKLAMGSPEIQRQAAYELRLLAKTGMDNRRIISEAGAIPFLVTLLCSTDPRIQENAVTALLNLSIFDNNKILIMAAGAIDSIVKVLESGHTMEARENAAATIYSLSMINDYKTTIGGRPRAIPALVTLLREGTTTGKRDAALALFNLAVNGSNKAGLVGAGAVRVLVEILVDDRAGVTDEALGVLGLLLDCGVAVEEMRRRRVLVGVLVDLLRVGSSKGKESAVGILLGMCREGGGEVAGRLLMNPKSVPALQSLAGDGSLKARRKADAVLRLLNRCCISQSNATVGDG